MSREPLTVSEGCSRELLAFYGRLSTMKSDVVIHELGLDRQEVAADVEAQRQGFRIGRAYTDPALSASKRNVWRPEFEQMLIDLPHWGGLACADFDRVTRHPAVLERLIEIYEKNPHLVFVAPGTPYDLSTADGRMMARAKINMANYEAEQAAKRQRARHAQRREAGKPGGSHRPFGLNADRISVNEAEQAILIRAAEDLVAGKPIHQIKREWDQAGITATTGKLWSRSAMRNMLMSPRMVGYLVSKPAGDPVPRHLWYAVSERTGERIKAQHGPILPEPLWMAVVAELEGRRRPQQVRPSNVARYLLSGLMTCGRPGCGQPMRGMWIKAKGRHVYACQSGCSTVHGPKADETITGMLLEHWETSPLVEISDAPFAHAEQIAIKRQQLVALTEAFAGGVMDVADYAAGRAAVRDQLEPLERLQREWQREHFTGKPMGTVDQWNAADLDGKRLMARRELLMIVVAPAVRGRRPFDPQRLDPRWRD
jgi:site-specific DNA recombinase